MVVSLKLIPTLLIVAHTFGTSSAMSADLEARPVDPCLTLVGQDWVYPKDVRDCFASIKLDLVIKDNIIQVINRTLPFHTSLNYQVQAPPPFADTQEDLVQDLARIQAQDYESEYEFHLDLSRSFRRLNDGHCVWLYECYVTLFVNYVPTPLVLLTANDGSQNVYIAPEAFDIASVEFSDQIDFWQNALPDALKGQLASLSGARVLTINEKDPFIAVNSNAQVTGDYQGFGTRQNAFFSSYRVAWGGWIYIFGDFAQQSLPLSDSVTLKVQRVNHTGSEDVVLPYRSKSAIRFSSTAAWRSGHCTNQGSQSRSSSSSASRTPLLNTRRTGQAPTLVAEKPLVNVIRENALILDMSLPSALVPRIKPITASRHAAEFYMLGNNKTGVLALGSFEDEMRPLMRTFLEGLRALKVLGATQLIIDVTNNGGGVICAAHWLHRIIAGPKSTTVPQSGLDTKARASPLAQLILQQVVDGKADPKSLYLYNPTSMADSSGRFFNVTENWLMPPVPTTVNGREDAFSQRLGAECAESNYPSAPPGEALFDPKQVVIVSNGRCASSCALFSITMNKLEGSKTVVVGGKQDVQQQYCGTVGGQSTDSDTILSDVAITHLSNHTLAPPQSRVYGSLGITWRLAYGVDNPHEPEEWQDHPADFNLPLTAAIVNNPAAIWNAVANDILS